MKRIFTILSIAITLPLMSQSFEEGEKIFKQNCTACHKMDKKVVGPALQNVVEEQGADWVYSWVKNNQTLRESGDSHANEVYEEYNQSVMPAYEYLGDDGLNNVVEYLKLWKGKQEAKTPVVTTSNGPTMVQQAPYEMPIWIKIFMGIVVLFGVMTAFMGIKTSRVVAEAYIYNQATTSHLLKKYGETEESLHEDFTQSVDDEINRRVNKKVKKLKKDINQKLKGFE